MNLIVALHLHPIALRHSMDADHLISTVPVMQLKLLREFANKVNDKSKLFITSQLLKVLRWFQAVNMPFQSFNVRIDSGSYLFDIETPRLSFK
jgi:hypothetical protein